MQFNFAEFHHDLVGNAANWNKKDEHEKFINPKPMVSFTKTVYLRSGRGYETMILCRM